MSLFSLSFSSLADIVGILLIGLFSAEFKERSLLVLTMMRVLNDLAFTVRILSPSAWSLQPSFEKLFLTELMLSDRFKESFWRVCYLEKCEFLLLPSLIKICWLIIMFDSSICYETKTTCLFKSNSLPIPFRRAWRFSGEVDLFSAFDFGPLSLI